MASSNSSTLWWSKSKGYGLRKSLYKISLDLLELYLDLEALAKMALPHADTMTMRKEMLSRVEQGDLSKIKQLNQEQKNILIECINTFDIAPTDKNLTPDTKTSLSKVPTQS